MTTKIKPGEFSVELESINGIPWFVIRRKPNNKKMAAVLRSKKLKFGAAVMKITAKISPDGVL